VNNGAGGSLSEQSLDAQHHALQEQNERTRINLEVDLMHKLGERWESRAFRDFRTRSVEYITDPSLWKANWQG
jgi:hypothetical protein